jgi:hypothetical protein
MPARTIADRQFNLGFLNTAVDALALVLFGVGLAVGIFRGQSNPLLTWLPAGMAAAGIAAALVLGRRGAKRAQSLEARHPKLAAAIGSLAGAVDATGRILFHRGSGRSVLGALTYLGVRRARAVDRVPRDSRQRGAGVRGGYDGVHHRRAWRLGPAAGRDRGRWRVAGMLVLYGVGRNAAITAVLLYEAVGLLVPLIGGGLAYLFLRREFGPMKTARDVALQPAER